MEKNSLKPDSFKKIRKKYQNLVDQINSFEDSLKILSDSELRTKNYKLQKQSEENNNLNSLIAESFALTREASLRTLGLRHFDVQLIGGLVLNNEQIAEMKTGEGKTLVATLPACLNALTGKGVHIVTVNNYLARRDQVSMGQIYRFLGFCTGLIQNKMSKGERRKNYKADITYLTNDEVAFDYLRDNTGATVGDIVLRPFNYCILDEVDSILIDEAQTPLVLSNSIETPVEKYILACEITKYLARNIHYTVDEKNKNVTLTDEGSKQVETILRIKNLYNPSDPWIPYVINALRANSLFFNNVQYILQNNRIVIVDEFTGRIMPDRRWSDGLHQAIEAKENVPVNQISETNASITYQNFFLLYPKLSGMTGTGKTAEMEFEKIYNLSVEEIPSARPNLRKDLPDLIYADQFSKWNAIAENCNKISSTGQPILIGTTTVQKSEMLAELLNEYKLFYQLLNAKPENVRRESEIVAQAGKKNAITIATNMAGRGTDIVLGGNIKFQTQKELYNILTLSRSYSRSKKIDVFQSSLKTQLPSISQKFLSVLLSLLSDQKFLKLSEIEILKILRQNDSVSLPDTSYKCSIKFLVNELKVYYKKQQEQESKIIKNLGGLYIIGTERNDSRRVDNQLRGRCGRQGDPGTSRFFVSLEDKLLKLFGGLRVKRLMEKMMVDDLPLENKFLTKSLNSSQQQVEEIAYQQRKILYDYDDILNVQRQIIYFERSRILKNFLFNRKPFLSYGEQIITDLLVEFKQEFKRQTKLGQLLEKFIVKNSSVKYLQTPNFLTERVLLPDFKTYLFNDYWSVYKLTEKRHAIRGKNSFFLMVRFISLQVIDRIWREHLQKLSVLREEIRWRGYGQQNPLQEYKKEAFNIFKSRKEMFRSLVLLKFLQVIIIR